MSARMFFHQVTRLCNAAIQITKARLRLLGLYNKCHPSYSPALATFLDTDSSTYGNLADPLEFDGFLYAVPKKRRTLEKRRKMSFGFGKRMEHAQPKENIVTCPQCGHWHESHTICGHCYDKVRKSTAEMKAQLEKDDAYYFNQTKANLDELLKERGIESNAIRTEKDRYAEELTWWSENLKKKVK